jgi:hypothetical protein
MLWWKIISQVKSYLARASQAKACVNMGWCFDLHSQVMQSLGFSHNPSSWFTNVNHRIFVIELRPVIEKSCVVVMLERREAMNRTHNTSLSSRVYSLAAQLWCFSRFSEKNVFFDDFRPIFRKGVFRIFGRGSTSGLRKGLRKGREFKGREWVVEKIERMSVMMGVNR